LAIVAAFQLSDKKKEKHNRFGNARKQEEKATTNLCELESIKECSQIISIPE
jgi:hypothetical protein